MPDRRTQLLALIDALDALGAALAHDPGAGVGWRRHFLDCWARAQALAEVGAPPSQDALSALAGSVMSVYGGMGSFTDYAPVVLRPDGGFAVVVGLEDLASVAGRVYEAALALRVVEG